MKEKVWVGIDPSLRSTGITLINENEDIVKIYLIDPSANDYKDENLLSYIEFETEKIFMEIAKNYDIQKIALERLAHGGSSGSKDKICAGWWMIRIAIQKVLLNLNNFNVIWPPLIVACNTWRKDIITKEDREQNKKNPSKLFLKECPYNKIPDKNKNILLTEVDKLDKKTKTTIYDLSDSYWIACYAKKNS